MPWGRKLAVVVVIACLATIGAIAWWVVPQDTPERSTLAGALERFRQRDPSSEASSRVHLGVYRYRTRGEERVEASDLLDATHNYDGVSTVILSPSSCGVRERWEVLDARWSEAAFCDPPDGNGLRQISEFHEFFGVARRDNYHCRGSTLPRQVASRVGDRITSNCDGGDNAATTDSRVLGATTVDVAGEQVEAIHTRSRIALRGQVSGTTQRDEWRRRSDGLLLRSIVITHATREETISANYQERYTLKLLSLRPRR